MQVTHWLLAPLAVPLAFGPPVLGHAVPADLLVTTATDVGNVRDDMVTSMLPFPTCEKENLKIAPSP